MTMNDLYQECKDMIKFEGQWKEAGEDFPWENDANNGAK